MVDVAPCPELLEGDGLTDPGRLGGTPVQGSGLPPLGVAAHAGEEHVPGFCDEGLSPRERGGG